MIDSESARIATALADEKSLQKLERILSEMKKASEKDDGKAFSKHDLKFHVTIVKLTGNPMIIKAYDILLNVLEESMLTVIEKMKYDPALRYHKEILDAMRSKDEALAEQLMREHIQLNYTYFN